LEGSPLQISGLPFYILEGDIMYSMDMMYFVIYFKLEYPEFSHRGIKMFACGCNNKVNNLEVSQ
jgi:hypothetical protein